MHRRGLLSIAALLIAMLALIAPPRVTRADDTLDVSAAVMKDFDEYKGRFRPLFFAVSADGLFSGYIYCIDAACDTSAQTRRHAIQLCERAGGTDCRIFAVGRDIQVKYRVGDLATMGTAKSPPCVAESVAAGSPAAAVVANLRPAECSNFRGFRFHEDFKAFATTDFKNAKNTWGWAYRHADPDAAMKGALDRCNQGRKDNSVSDPCRVFAIGAIVVYGMTDAQLRAAADLYKKNKEATNADLPAVPQ